MNFLSGLQNLIRGGDAPSAPGPSGVRVESTGQDLVEMNTELARKPYKNFTQDLVQTPEKILDVTHLNGIPIEMVEENLREAAPLAFPDNKTLVECWSERLAYVKSSGFSHQELQAPILECLRNASHGDTKCRRNGALFELMSLGEVGGGAVEPFGAGAGEATTGVVRVTNQEERSLSIPFVFELASRFGIYTVDPESIISIFKLEPLRSPLRPI